MVVINENVCDLSDCSYSIFQTLLKKYETEAWQDLASVYGKLGSLSDAETCLDKARSISFYSPRGWNETGMEKTIGLKMFSTFIDFALVDNNLLQFWDRFVS